mmetsp:Transcript_22252/g.77108  ORF Transcript_22252/g.77108 Transcript_22252/m.77108 type:complete len:416 (-) Transcript_22252:639-1886(-)
MSVKHSGRARDQSERRRDVWRVYDGGTGVMTSLSAAEMAITSLSKFDSNFEIGYSAVAADPAHAARPASCASSERASVIASGTFSWREATSTSHASATAFVAGGIFSPPLAASAAASKWSDTLTRILKRHLNAAGGERGAVQESLKRSPLTVSKSRLKTRGVVLRTERPSRRRFDVSQGALSRSRFEWRPLKGPSQKVLCLFEKPVSKDRLKKPFRGTFSKRLGGMLERPSQRGCFEGPFQGADQRGERRVFRGPSHEAVSSVERHRFEKLSQEAISKDLSGGLNEKRFLKRLQRPPREAVSKSRLKAPLRKAVSRRRFERLFQSAVSSGRLKESPRGAVLRRHLECPSQRVASQSLVKAPPQGAVSNSRRKVPRRKLGLKSRFEGPSRRVVSRSRRNALFLGVVSRARVSKSRL